jgi:hypothetical protein
MATPPVALAQGSASATGAITFIGTTGNNSLVTLGITPVPTAGTCTMYGNYEFIFDAGTAGGKNMYAWLLELKALGKNVSIDYTYSTTPGTNQNSGCTLSTLAVVVNLYAAGS